MRTNILLVTFLVLLGSRARAQGTIVDVDIVIPVATIGEVRVSYSSLPPSRRSRAYLRRPFIREPYQQYIYPRNYYTYGYSGLVMPTTDNVRVVDFTTRQTYPYRRRPTLYDRVYIPAPTIERSLATRRVSWR